MDEKEQKHKEVAEKAAEAERNGDYMRKRQDIGRKPVF